MPRENAHQPLDAHPGVAQPTIRIAPEVRARVTGDSATVIDLRRDLYIALNPVGARIWPLLEAGHHRSAILSRLATSFPEQTDHLAQDFDAFVDALVDQRLLVRAATGTPETSTPTAAPTTDLQPLERPSNNEHSTRASRPPSLLRCWATLVAIDITLHTVGFPTLRKRIARRKKASGFAMSTLDITATCRQMDRAARAYFKRAWCLQRSAALVWLLRGRGVASDLVLGVRPIPFAAHAWSEVDGKVINDVPTVRETYREIDRCRAAATGARS